MLLLNINIVIVIFSCYKKLTCVHYQLVSLHSHWIYIFNNSHNILSTFVFLFSFFLLPLIYFLLSSFIHFSCLFLFFQVNFFLSLHMLLVSFFHSNHYFIVCLFFFTIDFFLSFFLPSFLPNHFFFASFRRAQCSLAQVIIIKVILYFYISLTISLLCFHERYLRSVLTL